MIFQNYVLIVYNTGGERTVERDDHFPHIRVSFLNNMKSLQFIPEQGQSFDCGGLEHPPLFLRETGLSWIRPFTILDRTP